MKNPFLIGQATYLRPLDREDAAIVQPWVNDPEVRRMLRGHRPFSLQFEEEFIQKLNHDEQNLALLIVHKELDRPIGITGFMAIDAKNRHALFGISIGEKEFWGQGLGGEVTRLMAAYAFDTLNLNRICLHVYEYNERGLRTYERVGFQREGVLRQDIFSAGRYWDTIVMGLLRDEWRANVRG